MRSSRPCHSHDDFNIPSLSGTDERSDLTNDDATRDLAGEIQNILWRNSPDKPIKCIRLDTVTYGLKSSSYLATRCLYELANRYEDRWPLASFILKNCTYVDDVCYADANLDILLEARDQLTELLRVASLETHKWSSNSSDVLKAIPSSKQLFGNLDLQKDCSVKTLGLTIDAKRDRFTLQCPKPCHDKPITKREILSYISKIYDPLGFVSPIVVKAKEFMKRVWCQKLNWNDTPSERLTSEWSQFTNSLAAMQPIHINRNIPIPYSATVQLIGFADASSTTAYGCCVYLRVVQPTGEAILYLLCSKSRINPSAKPLTIPRLELNACLLLSNLIAKVYETLSIKVKINSTYLFSDSKIALAWINTEPTRLQAYVANRVKVVQQLTSRWCWLYVPTNDNPADLVSRGLDPHQLADCSSWWNGPSFLSNREYKFERDNNNYLPCPDSLPEMKTNSEPSKAVNKTVLLTQTQNNFFDFLNRYSDISKMTRVLAFILRFCHNIKSSNSKMSDKCLSSSELEKALLLIIKNEQRFYFQEEIHTISKGESVKGNIKPLCPFIDQEGLMRVSGRLQNSNLSFEQKHPIILPKESRITGLIIQREHIRLLHAGPKLLLASLNQKYWLVNGIRQVKKITHKCLTCFRFKANAAKQLMGSLPRQRVNASRPFQAVGIDFAGPVQVKNSRVRRAVISKGYICVYVCFSTKAIHLELASDLTTETFLACFKRFISRRGMPSDVYCDNAATFRCAQSQLEELFKLNNSQDHRKQVCNFASQNCIKFHFTPSYSPVFAGLVEAGVKSIKYHLRRVIQKGLFTYEQLNTILNQIEAVVNSRPLLPVTSSSVTDFAYLTPGHFLIGAPLTSFPQKDLSETPDNRLKFWNLIEKVRQGFWKTWSKNYLNSLQSRPKWRDVLPNITVGTMVIIREPNNPPLNWSLGRIVKIFPGSDGKVRVLEVAAPNGKTYMRSLSGICPLPLQE
ncbi:unnamed protein product [Euphydryas editha]|uniref:Integrase catalytic domain-containing protein n=1 Tax=Euphydryas editha TaxID=104508 RepID=A0AAU9U3E9_EUPED|nr:unnamed protein product [Euphydryas editha]